MQEDGTGGSIHSATAGGGAARALPLMNTGRHEFLRGDGMANACGVSRATASAYPVCKRRRIRAAPPHRASGCIP